MCCFSCCCRSSPSGDQRQDPEPTAVKNKNSNAIVSQPKSSTRGQSSSPRTLTDIDDPKSTGSTPSGMTVRKILETMFSQGTDEYSAHLEFSNLDAINERIHFPVEELGRLKSLQFLICLQLRLDSLLHETGRSPDDPELLQIQSALAAELVKQTGQFKKSLDLSIPVFEAYKTKYGPTDEKTLGIQLLVACTLNALYREREAIEYFEQVYEMTKEENSSSLTPGYSPLQIRKMNHSALASMAHSLKRLGECEEAMKTYEKVYQFRVQLYGEFGNETIGTRFSMAQVLKKQGKAKEALSMVLNAYADVEKCDPKIGDDDNSLLWKEHFLATLLRDQAHPLVAYKVLLEVLRKQVRVKGPLCNVTLSTILNLGILFEREGKLELALSVYDNVCKKFDAVLGKEHPKAVKARKRMDNLMGLSSSSSGGWDFVMHLGLDAEGKLVGHGEKVYSKQ